MKRASSQVGVEYFKQVTDPILRAVLAKLATQARLYLVVTSGDRPKPVSGGSISSLHMLGCAADLWMPGYGTGPEQQRNPRLAFDMSKEIFDAAKRYARVVFLPGSMYEVVLHGLSSHVNVQKGRMFGQPHCHIGRDRNSHLSAVQFKLEGVAEAPATMRAKYQQAMWVELPTGKPLLAAR